MTSSNLFKTVLMLATFINFIEAKGYLDGRIVGGINADIKSYPYQVSVTRRLGHLCGGSIIHYSYVITAAHCVHQQSPLDYAVRVGNSGLFNGAIYKVEKFYIHDKFNPDTMDNDIAILKLQQSLKFSDSILPIALPEAGEEVEAGRIALVTGWGYTSENGTASLQLQVVEVPMITHNTCYKQYYPNEIVTKNMICAGYVGTGGRDACQGDSGGPLRVKGKLMGIVSWGYGCARREFPGVYTKVSNYRNWIKKMIYY